MIAYRAGLGGTLGELGLLYREIQRLDDAEAALKEAVGIERELAAQDPAVYQSVLATTLNGLGALYTDTHRFADAETTLKEAVGIERELAVQNPAYRPVLATTLNSLVLYTRTHSASPTPRPP